MSLTKTFSHSHFGTLELETVFFFVVVLFLNFPPKNTDENQIVIIITFVLIIVEFVVYLQDLEHKYYVRRFDAVPRDAAANHRRISALFLFLFFSMNEDFLKNIFYISQRKIIERIYLIILIIC